MKVIEEPKFERNFECQECGKKLSSRKTLEHHFRQMHQPWTHNYFCNQCSFSAFQKGMLKQHIWDKHAVGDQLKCDLCPFVAKRGGTLASHKINRHQGPRKKCPECGELCQTKGKLAKHIWVAHGMRYNVKKYNPPNQPM